MTKREIAVLACKILAIYVALQAVSPLAYGVVSLGDAILRGRWEVQVGQILALILAIVPYVVIGTILWWQANRLATHMVSGMTEAQAPEVKVIETDIQPIAFSVVGLLILAEAFASAVSLLSTVLYQNWRSLLASVTLYNDAVETVTRLAVGLWLLLGSRGLAKFLNRVRGLGTADSDDILDETQD